MKFNDGYWLLRDGVTARYATEALDVRAEAGRGSIAVLTRPVEHRGSHLNTPTITVELSAPAPGVVAVRASHFVPTEDPVPAFALTPVPGDARVERGDGTLRLTSGRLVAEAAVAGEWGLRFAGDGVPLTGSGTRSLGAMTDAGGGAHMVERLRLPVGANVYGLGERFTPFVKNGQVVDIWQADGGTASEQAYKNVPFYLTNARLRRVREPPGPRVVRGRLGGRVAALQFSVEGQALEYFVDRRADARRRSCADTPR